MAPLIPLSRTFFQSIGAKLEKLSESLRKLRNPSTVADKAVAGGCGGGEGRGGGEE